MKILEVVEFRDINSKYIACSDGTIWRRLGCGDIAMVSPTIDKYGKKRVGIFYSGVYKICYVHKLVIGAF